MCRIGHHIVADRTSALFNYGAIFKYVPPDGACRHPSAPRYIVAFRGTMRRDATTLGDMRLNLSILLNKQHLCSRFRDARERVANLLSSIVVPNSGATGNRLVWLAGHSLGASIALDVGRHMMNKMETNMPSFLFNPPQVSLPAVIDRQQAAHGGGGDEGFAHHELHREARTG